MSDRVEDSIDGVTASLELVEEDVTPAIYERFFAANAAARELMGHSDDYMRGRMFEQVVDLLLHDEHLEPDGYLDWELDNHLVAYRVTGAMYRDFFDATLNCVRDAVGAAWTDRFEAAWKDRLARIMAQIERHHAYTAA